jgi:flagellar hook-basal body complex protein FliE
MTVQSVAMQQALEQLRSMREAVRPVDAGAEQPRGIAVSSTSTAPSPGSFLDTMRSAVDSVNEQQRVSRELQTSYVRGEDVSLTDVAIAMQRSSVAFEATVQVRNKILESYKEIMNMTV